MAFRFDLKREPEQTRELFVAAAAPQGRFHVDLRIGQQAGSDPAVRGKAEAAAGGAVAGQADDAHVVAEVLAPELGADAVALGDGQDLGLQLAPYRGRQDQTLPAVRYGDRY